MASHIDGMTKDWQVGKSLADCLGHMLENRVACDVTFEVQTTGNPYVTKIPAHKLILQARSPVFEAMFSGAFMEASGHVAIMDINPQPFEDMLQYIYTDNVVLTSENVVPLMYAAKKYILENLVHKCNEFLEKEMSRENVCSILEDSVIQQDEELVNKCLDLIAPNVETVVKTEAFFKMSHDALLEIVGCDHLAHGVEAELFEACIEWGRRRTKNPDNATGEEIRDIIGTKCLHNIRFPYIPLKKFGAKFAHSSVINEHEKCLVYSLLATKEESFSKALSDLGYDVISRMIRANRYEHHYEGLHAGKSSKLIEIFNFSVNKPIQLRGMSIHGGLRGSDHRVKITIHDVADEETPCAQVEQTITASEDYKPIPVYFRKLKVNVNTEYHVRVSVEGKTKTSCSWKPIDQITERKVTITSEFIKHPLKYSQHGAGLVAQFLFQILPAIDEKTE